MQNYSIQTECNQSVDILNLRVQRQILRSSAEYLRDKLDLERAKRKSLQREAKAQEERDRSRLNPDTESEEEAVQQIGGKTIV